MGFLRIIVSLLNGFLKIPWVRASLAFAIGFALARILPPFVMDDGFWRDFTTGPPAAGIFAVIAASIAYGAAVHSSSVAKQTASEENARKQVEMAIGMAVDESGTKRMVGLKLLDVLFGKHGEDMDGLIYSVSTHVSALGLDDADAKGDNSGKAGD